MTNAPLKRYQQLDYINIQRGKNIRIVIAPLFSKLKGRTVESALLRKWIKY